MTRVCRKARHGSPGQIPQIPNCSIHKSLASLRPSALCRFVALIDVSDGVLQDVEPGVGFGLADDQRWANANAVLAGAQEQAPVSECQLDDLVANRTCGSLALLVVY